MRRAFTLVELLAATALSAALMLAVFQVVGALGRTRAALNAAAVHPSWHEQILELLRRDLVHSSSAKFGPNVLTLIGSASLRSDMRDVVHEPVIVSYSIQSVHGRPWLVRRQTGRTVRRNDKPFVELVSADVGSFTVTPSGGLAVTSAEGQTIPAAVALTLRMTSGTEWGGRIVVR